MLDPTDSGQGKGLKILTKIHLGRALMKKIVIVSLALGLLAATGTGPAQDRAGLT